MIYVSPEICNTVKEKSSFLYAHKVLERMIFLLGIDCLDEFKLECELRRLSPRTIKGYYGNTARFLQFVYAQYGVDLIEDISGVHVKKYMLHLISKGLSPSYANGIMKGLRSYFKFAISEEYIHADPCKKVHWQKEGKVLIETFSDDEVARLLNAFGQTDYLSIRNKLILAVAFDTGARNAEMCDILHEDIRANVILIHGKGNKERNVPITPYVKRIMIRYERMKEQFFLAHRKDYDNYFLSRTGRPLTVEAVERVFNQANEKAHVREEIRCSPHTARHYYAQSNLRNGLDVYSLSRLLGHENINITKRYLQSIQDENVVEMAVKTSPLMNIKF